MQPLWTLRGSGVLCARAALGVEAFVHYDDSPVGAYDERAHLDFTLRGPRVVWMPVSSAPSCRAGRALWGFPKTVDDLEWQRHMVQRHMVQRHKGQRHKGQRHEGRICFRQGQEYFRFRAFGPTLPLRAAFWTAQERGGRMVRVPFALRARTRLAFRGKQWALLLDEFEMQVFPPK